MTSINELKQIAKAKKMTYKEIAERSGVPEGTIKNIFADPARCPRIDTITKIEQALGIGWTEEEQAAGISPVVVRNITPEEDDLLEYFRELGIKKGAKAQATALEMMKKLTEI